jgi:uncharacterized repeat protein (TIGR01451 family)
MFDRLLKWKRPRGFALLAIVAGIVVMGVAASVALALVSDTGTYDITVQDKDHSAGPLPLSPSGGSVEYIGSSASNQASGTGLFDPFVRLQGSPTEKGYNTDGAVQFDTKSGTWTHAIKVNAIPIVDCDGTGPGTATCWELFNDINESNTAKRISLNVVEVWFTTNANLVGYVDPTGFPAGATKEYEFNGDILINDVNQGSGRGDLRYLIPTAGHTWTADTYFVLYSKWGVTPSSTTSNFGTGSWESDGGFEEWKVRKTPNVSIVKTADAASVNAGSNIGFTITVTNSGVADATGVTINDPLPGGSGIDWAESPDNPNCSISGSPPSETLTCGPVTLAAGGGFLSVHVQSATTAASCGTYNNTATFTSTNAGTGSASASVTVNCAAIRILKNSSKGGAANAGAVFAVDGPDAGTDPDFSVTDDTTAAAPDEDADAGEVCVSGLIPGATYNVTETSPPTGYAGESGSKTVVAVSGNCATAGLNSVTFTDPPLFDIQVNFKDGGSGETDIGPSPAVIDCNTTTGTESTTATAPWTDTLTVTGVQLTSATMTITCTIPVDP